jgi:hypothetical protein
MNDLGDGREPAIVRLSRNREQDLERTAVAIVRELSFERIEAQGVGNR